MNSPPGTLGLWGVWGRARTQEVHPRLCPSSAQLCGVAPCTPPEPPDTLLAGGAQGATFLRTIQPGCLEWPNTVLILSSPKTLKLEVVSKDGFFSPSWVYCSETMANVPKPQCQQLSNTQVKAEKSPKTVTARLFFQTSVATCFQECAVLDM